MLVIFKRSIGLRKAVDARVWRNAGFGQSFAWKGVFTMRSFQTVVV